MKKLSKLLILSLSALTCFTACGNTSSSSEEVPPSSSEAPIVSSSSSEETVDANALVAEAADYLWQMYKDIDSKKVTGTFDVVNKVVIGGLTVNVSWKMDVTGAQGGFTLTKKDDNYSTVYIGYFDSKVTEDSSVKLIPTLTYGEVSKTLADVFADKDVRHSIDFTTPKLVIGDHASWDAAEAGETVTVKGTVIDVIATGSSTGSFYMIDDKGNGYYVYAPVSKGAKQGDEVVVSGAKKVFNGQEEFDKGCAYQVMKKGDASAIPFVDASADWAAAASSKVSDKVLGNKYQNIPVTLKNCTPTRVAGSYYYFTVGEGKAEFNVYWNTYFLSETQANTWANTFKDAIANGYTLTIDGIATVFSNVYQVYGSSLRPSVVTKEAELTVDQKHEMVKSKLLSAVAESYDSETTFAPDLPAYASVTYEVTAPTANASAAVVEGKLKLTPINAEVTNTVVAHVTVGKVTKDVTLTFVTEDASLAKFKTGEIAYSNITVGEESKVAATYAKGGEVEVTVLATKVEESKGDMKITGGGSILVTAPAGYTISKVEVDSNGTYNNLDFWTGSDKATQFDDNADGNTYRATIDGRTLTTIPVNGSSLYIENTSTHNVYSHWIKVTLTIPVADLDQDKVALTPANFLADSKDQYVKEEATTTINNVGLKYIQMANYASDGIRMRVKEGVQAYLATTTAIESGIKSVSISILDSKQTYDNTNYMTIEFSNNADFSEAEAKTLATTAGTYDYTITPSVATYKYVRITYNNTQGTCYMDSIVIDY